MTWYYMPYTSAQDTEGSSSDSSSPESIPEPWLILSGTATQRPYSWRGWKNRSWIKLLSGLTSPHSMLTRGLDAWISSLPVSRANRSQSRELSAVSMTSDGSGQTLPGSLLTWDPDSCSWRTSPDLFGTVYHTSSQTLPSSGSMRNGVCTQRQRLGRHISANGSGSWHTPTAHLAQESATANKNRNEPGLWVAAGMWATPVARDDQKTPDAHLAAKQRLLGRGSDAAITSLTVQIKAWPTATGMDSRGSGGNPTTTGTHGLTLTDASTRQDSLPQGLTQRGEAGSQRVDLNPRFVEALMGLPAGWLTPCILAGTGSFHAWQRAHSLSLPEDLASQSDKPEVEK